MDVQGQSRLLPSLCNKPAKAMIQSSPIRSSDRMPLLAKEHSPAGSENPPSPSKQTAARAQTGMQGLSARANSVATAAPENRHPPRKTPSLTTSLRGPKFDEALAQKKAPELLAYFKTLEKSLGRSHLQFNNQDTRFLRQMVDGLNGADPALKLDLLTFDTDSGLKGLAQSGLVTRLRKGMQDKEQWQAVLDHGGRHRIALSFKCNEDSISIIVVDSLPHSDASAEALSLQWTLLENQLTHYLNRRRSSDLQPVLIQSQIVFSGAQKSQEGCCVFALSAAKKMAAEPEIGAMHDQTLKAIERNDFSDIVPTRKSDALPPSFIKHATSGSEIRQYASARNAAMAGLSEDVAQVTVNSKGQTLQQRHAKHEVTRTGPLPPLTFTSAILECLGFPREPTTVKYSNSYEHKRIDFVRAALAHIAPPSEPSSSDIKVG